MSDEAETREREGTAWEGWFPGGVVRHGPPRDFGPAHHGKARSELRVVRGERRRGDEGEKRKTGRSGLVTLRRGGRLMRVARTSGGSGTALLRKARAGMAGGDASQCAGKASHSRG